MKKLALATVLLSLTSCGSVSESAHISTVQQYGPYPEEKYVLCQPPIPTTRVAIIVHGGGWWGGSEENPRDIALCRSMAVSGILGISIGYRLTGADPWPAQLLDAQLAIRWARAAFSPEAVCVVGTSAGGHIALMTGELGYRQGKQAPADPLNETALYSDQDQRPDCVVSISGPTDLLELPPRLDRVVKRLVSGSTLPLNSAKAAASPVTHAHVGMAPVLIVQGSRDETVPPSQGHELVDLLAQFRAKPVDGLIEYDGGHVFGGVSTSMMAAYTRQIADFISTTK